MSYAHRAVLSPSPIFSTMISRGLFARAQASVSASDVRVTQRGGPSPKIDLSGTQASVTF